MHAAARAGRQRHQEGLDDRRRLSACGRDAYPRAKRSPVQTRRGAEEYERQVRQELLAGTYGKGEVVSRPTPEAFSKEFLSTYAVNNNKPSSIESKRYMLKMHLVPALGGHRLDEIGQKEIETYKSQK